MSGEATLSIHGEILLLHPDRAVIWPARRTVIVADTHFGKSSVFGHHGLAVPAGADELDRERLRRLIGTFDLQRLIVLGDFFHAPLAVEAVEACHLERWADSLAGIRIQVIAGNHDRGISSGWRGPLEWIDGEHAEAPFRFVHDAAVQSGADRPFSLSGHVHPVVAIRALRKRALRVPVFWLREQGLVLPSFGVFTGGHRINPGPGERVYAISPDRVVPFPGR